MAFVGSMTFVTQKKFYQSEGEDVGHRRVRLQTRRERDELRTVRGRGRMPRLFARRPTAQEQQEEELELPTVPTDPVKLLVIPVKIFTVIGTSMVYKVL